MNRLKVFNSQLRSIFKDIFKRFLESLISVIPMLLIVLILYATQFIFINNNLLNEEIITLSLLLIFIISGITLALGIGIFSLGADMSMSEIGRSIGEDLTKRKSLVLIIIIAILLGTLITIAEPDLTVLADYIPSKELNPWILKIAVGLGVGIFLAIGIIRILLNQSIKLYIVLFYLILFMIASLYGDDEQVFLELSFDSGGVTTGSITVPFLMSFGIGVAGTLGGSKAKDNSFGLTGLCSIGPIIVVMILGLIVKPESLIPQTSDSLTFEAAILNSLEEVSLAILPTLAFFIFYNIFFLRLHYQKLIRILFGFLYTFIGLVIFLTSATYGFIPVSKAIGVGFIDFKLLLIIIAILIGASIILAEPSVHILNSQVEDISNGAIKKKELLFSLCLASSLAILISVLKAFYFPELKILYILVPGYIISFILSIFVDDIYVAIAFDSGGIACGSMASAFVMPFIIGITSMDDSSFNGFGVIGIITMMPIITIQLLGVTSKVKVYLINKRARERVMEEDDKQFITFKNS